MIVLPSIFQLLLLHRLIIETTTNEQSNDYSMSELDLINSCEQNLKSNGILSSCVGEAREKWHCVISENWTDTLAQIKLNCGPSDAMLCCPMWTVIDCILHQSSKLCHHNSYHLLLQQILQVQDEACSQYLFNTSDCKSMLDFITNIELLDSVAKDLNLTNFINHPNELHLIDFGTHETETQLSRLYWIKAVAVLMILVIVVSSTLVAMNVWKDFI